MKNRGFTLVELLITITIIALLAAYAIPNYRQFVLESKRSGAHNRMLEIAGMNEKFYANTNAYPTGLTGGGAALNLSAAYLTTDDYQLTMATGAGTWTLTATAINNQKYDTTCLTITFSNLGQKGPVDECWE